MSEPAPDWNPVQYERFKNERSRPFFDLLHLVRGTDVGRVLDLGCGTGELTRAMHERLHAKETVGVDSSDAMLAKAATFAAGGLRFEKGDIATYASDARFDLVFSNAALQWVDDHPRLLERLTALLAPGGQLAVQIPSNDDHPSHLVARDVARESPFREALGGHERVFPNLSLSDYATSLHRLGFREQKVEMVVYAHVLPSRDDVVEWVKGTLLTDYQKRMPAEMWPRFLERYRDGAAAEARRRAAVFLPVQADSVLGRAERNTSASGAQSGFTVRGGPGYPTSEEARRLSPRVTMRRQIEIAAMSMAIVATSACASSQPDIVRIQAASDFACNENRTTVREVREVDAEKTIFEATGCGHVADYACSLTTTTDINPRKKPLPATSCVAAPDEDTVPSTDGH